MKTGRCLRPLARPCRGLTLLELLVALALLALLATLTLPSFAGMAQRARLKAVAETLAADLNEARFEATQRGQALHLVFSPGADWCWAVARTPGCPCETRPAPACRLKAVRAADHGGIALLQSVPARLEPAGLAAGGVEVASGGGAEFQSPNGESLHVRMSPLGRASVCAPGAAGSTVPGYPPC
jgi:type IV fimbrial biogenesis protein FimT